MQIQFKFGKYRFDFLLNNKYIVEIDGATYHSSPEQIERDRIRDEYSAANGYSVLRIPASVVFNNSSEAIRRVKDFAFAPATAVAPQAQSLFLDENLYRTTSMTSQMAYRVSLRASVTQA